MADGVRKIRVERGIKIRSEGLFGLSSTRELLYVTAPRLVPMAILILLPLLVPPYWVKVITVSCIITLLALSWDFMHLLGMISLGQALFFGMGAYCSGVLNAYVGLPPMLTIPLGALLGGGLSTLMLMPVLRLRGLYFAMVTLALTSIMVRIIEATGLLGGTAGLSALDPLPNAWAEVYLAIFSAFACLFGLRRLDRSNYGVVLRGIGENDRAVLSSGVDVFRYKTQALFIGSTIGAFAGAFMTHTICCVGLAAFAMDNSVLPVASVVVGGAGTFAGAMVGAFLLVPLSEFLRAFGELRIVFYCLILILFIVVAPAGVFPYFQRLYHQTQRVVRTGEKDAV